MAIVNTTNLRLPYNTYATTAARDTANPSPTGGIYAYVVDISTLFLYDGGGWVIMSEPAQAWTPSISGVTLGTKQGTYHRADGWLDFQGTWTHGDIGSGVTGDLILTLPKVASIANASMFHGHAQGTTESPLLVGGITTSALAYRAHNSAGTYVAQTVCSSTIPFSWANGHIWFFAGRYPMSTRYL